MTSTQYIYEIPITKKYTKTGTLPSPYLVRGPGPTCFQTLHMRTCIHIYLFCKHAIGVVIQCAFWPPREMCTFLTSIWAALLHSKSCKAHDRKVGKASHQAKYSLFVSKVVPSHHHHPGWCWITRVPLKDFSKSGSQLLFKFLIFIATTNGLFQSWTNLHPHQ